MPTGTPRYAKVPASITLKAKITKVKATTRKASADGSHTAAIVTLCRSGIARSSRINAIERRAGSRFFSQVGTGRLSLVLVWWFFVVLLSTQVGAGPASFEGA